MRIWGFQLSPSVALSQACSRGCSCSSTMNQLLRQIAKFYYTDSNLGFTINFYPYLFAGAFTLGSVVLLGWILGVLEFDLSRVLNEDFGIGGGLTNYLGNYATAFTSTGLSGDPIAILQSQVALKWWFKASLNWAFKAKLLLQECFQSWAHSKHWWLVMKNSK